MFSKTNLISALVVAVWFYFGGYLLWDTIGGSLFENNAEVQADQLHLIIACVISAFIFSTIYSKMSGASGSSHGAQFGLWVGLFIGLGERWYDYAFQLPPIVMKDSLINAALNVVLFVVGGVLAGMLAQKLAPPSSE
jgi:hypothetical protein